MDMGYLSEEGFIFGNIPDMFSLLHIHNSNITTFLREEMRIKREETEGEKTQNKTNAVFKDI